MKDIGIHIDVDPPLDEVIKYLYCIETGPDFQRVSQRLSPNLEMMLIFNFGSSVNISFADEPDSGLKINRVAIIGPLRKMLNYEVLPKSSFIVIVFNPNGFYRLFQMPMDKIGSENVADPDKILQIDGFQKLWEQLNQLPDLHQKIELLKEYGGLFVKNADQATGPLLDGISYFENPLIQPVRAMATDSALSERTIQLRFRKYLGYSPKELLRFTRFKNLVNRILKDDRDVDWYGLVEEFGYHDQSHLIKDFNHYLGTTPHKFVRDIAGKEFCVSREGKLYD